MKVTKRYDGVKFRPGLLRSALETLFGAELDAKLENDDGYRSLSYERGAERWRPDDLEELLAEIDGDPEPDSWSLYVSIDKRLLAVEFNAWRTEVEVGAPTKVEIQRVLNAFNQAAPESRLPASDEPEWEQPRPVVFIGHGRSGDWRKIKDHLQDQQGYKVEAYEVGARAGHGIRDVLNSMLASSSFALLVMTAEDEGEGDLKRARQNVVHEAGLFQGTLGFHRAIAVVESGVEVFSNLSGIEQIRYPTDHVEMTYGPILATLRREFGDLR